MFLYNEASIKLNLLISWLGGSIINTGFRINNKNDLIYLTIPSFENTGLVKHCFTTRVGGVSEGVYSTLNTSPYKADPVDNVKNNLEIVCSAIDINYKDLVFSDQVHDDKIRIVQYSDKGKGIEKLSDIKNIDALITNIPGIPLITFYADCVPLLFLDPIKKVAALAHAGWKGTALKIGTKTLEKMKEVYGSQPSQCLVGIGPSIEKSCFEAGSEVAERFKKSYNNSDLFCESLGNGKYLIDLWKANMLSLTQIGVKEENITISGMCTKCNSKLFYSHRRQGEQRGSLSAIIELRADL